MTAINAAGGRVAQAPDRRRTGSLRLAVGAGGVWVCNATTGSIVASTSARAVVGPRSGSAAALRDHGRRRRRLGREQPLRHASPGSTRPAGALLGAPIPVGGRPGGIDAGTSVVWVANFKDNSVSRIDIQSGETIGDPIGVGRAPGSRRGRRRRRSGSPTTATARVTRIEP